MVSKRKCMVNKVSSDKSLPIGLNILLLTPSTSYASLACAHSRCSYTNCHTDDSRSPRTEPYSSPSKSTSARASTSAKPSPARRASPLTPSWTGRGRDKKAIGSDGGFVERKWGFRGGPPKSSMSSNCSSCSNCSKNETCSNIPL